MDYKIILGILPVLATVMPYVMSFIKPWLESTFIPKTKPTHDTDLRLFTAILTGLVGIVLLFATGQGAYIHSLQDVAVAFAAFIGYTVGGGAGALGLYSAVNSFLHQSPPATPTPTLAPELGVDKPGAQPVTRQPY